MRCSWTTHVALFIRSDDSPVSLSRVNSMAQDSLLRLEELNAQAGVRRVPDTDPARSKVK